jgi:hypothetical protein
MTMINLHRLNKNKEPIIDKGFVFVAFLRGWGLGDGFVAKHPREK